MKSKTSGILLCIGVIAASLVAAPEVFAFGYGYGSGATGGTTMFHVTNLNDSGTGSLRDALSAGGRHIVFDVSGTIEIKSVLVVLGNTYLDGSGKSITIHGNYVSISGHSNLIIRNIRFREDSTAPSDKCSLQGATCHDVMIDHCSIEWATYDCTEITANSYNVTIEYCIIGASIASQYSGGLIDSSTNISIHHNLWIDNKTRNPKLKMNGQYVNNVVYNWGATGGIVGGHSSAAWTVDIINNYFIKGPSSANNNWVTDCTANDHWYPSGNYTDMDNNGSLNGTLLTPANFTSQGCTVLTSRQWPSLPTDSAATAVSQATGGQWGCQPLDSTDTKYVGYLKSYGKTGVVGK